MTGPLSEPDPFEKIAEEFFARRRAGEQPSVNEYAERYPELANQIRELLPALLLMEKHKPVDQTSGPGPANGPRLAVPKQMGDFRLLREVGRGGMGIVYEAVQVSLDRHVALKVVSSHFLSVPGHLQRFEREARIAAGLHHTNIVPVFDVGEHEGIHYYAMQFIPGHGLDKVLREVQILRQERRDREAATLVVAPGHGAAVSIAASLISGRFGDSSEQFMGTEVSDDEPITLLPAPSHSASHLPLITEQAVSRFKSPSPGPYFRGVAEIGLQVAEALDYAQRQGVLHRDIKPSNLLLDLAGRVWITDFGLAKAEQSQDLTEPDQIPGTLRYMAPERFDGRVDTTSDLYSLGVTLYEMLTLRPAFEGADRLKLIEQMLRREAAPPRNVDSRIPRDLQTIVLKAMAKEPAARYATGGALAEDLRRFLADRPIQARRVGPAERLWRWGRRNPGMASLTGALAAALVVMAIAGLLMADRERKLRLRADSATAEAVENAQRETKARQQAEDATKREAAERMRADAETARLQRHRYVEHMQLAQRAWNQGRIDTMRQLLEQHRPGFDKEDLRGFEWYYWNRLADSALLTLGAQGVVTSLVFSPDCQRLAAASIDNTGTTVTLWDVGTGRKNLALKSGRGLLKSGYGFSSIVFSPDGRRLACGSCDGTIEAWNLAGQQVTALKVKAGDIRFVTFSPDGQRLASVSVFGIIKVWDTTSGLETLTLKGKATTSPDAELQTRIAFSPDGRRLALVSKDGAVKICHAASGGEILTLGERLPPGTCVAFSSDGRWLASGHADGTVHLWESAGRAGITLRVRGAQVSNVTFSPDGQRLASGSNDGTITIWDTARGLETLSLRDYILDVLRLSAGSPSPKCIAFSPNGRWLAWVKHDGTVSVWDAIGLAAPCLRRGGQTTGMAFSSGRKHFARPHPDGTIKVYDSASGLETATLRGSIYPFALFSPDGRRLASASTHSETVTVWNAADGLDTLTLKGHNGGVYTLAFSPDGRHLASGRKDKTISIWDAVTGSRVSTLKAQSLRGLALSLNAQYLASGSDDGTVNIWEVTAGQERLTLKGQAVWVFSPDGQRLASGSYDGTVIVWHIGGGRETLNLKGHNAKVWSLAFTPDGQRLASASEDETIKVWDVATGHLVLTLNGHRGPVWSVAFSPDGKRLASWSFDRTVKVWDAVVGSETTTLGAYSPLSNLEFSPDGQQLLGSEPQSGVQDAIWDARPLMLTLGAYEPAAPEPQSGQQIIQDAIWDARPLTDELRIDQEAGMLIRSLHNSIRLRHELIARIEKDALVRSQVRIRALDMAKRWREDPDQLHRESWAVVGRHDVHPDAYAFALKQATVACRSAPDNGVYLRTLGAAQFRAGKYPEALVTLSRSDQINSASKEGRHPGDVAFLAMTQFKLGHLEKARAAIGLLDQLMKQSHWSSNMEAQRFRREAAGLLIEACIKKCRVSLEKREFEKAAADLSEAIHLDRHNSQALSSRAYAFAVLGRWNEAAADLTPYGIDSPPNDIWFQVAGLRIMADDTKGYHLLCQVLPRALGTKMTGAHESYIASRTCSMEPQSGAHVADIVGWADNSVKSNSKCAWYLHTLGLAHYRAGHFDQATRYCQESMGSDSRWGGTVLNWLLLGMAYKRLGQSKESEQWLSKVAEWRTKVQQRMPTPQAASPPEMPLSDWVEFVVLYREAESQKLLRQK
jgi:WD40 repeat protein/serine/threonine protein kinase/tetratricopeptide (TPR) repeat protein